MFHMAYNLGIAKIKIMHFEFISVNHTQSVNYQIHERSLLGFGLVTSHQPRIICAGSITMHMVIKKPCENIIASVICVPRYHAMIVVVISVLVNY